jgi:hypothetical protein
MNANIERRALYNLLRMNWLNEPTLSLESWQVEDYRSLPLSALFERLRQFNIQLDRISTIAYADECDSPEELTDHLIGDRHLQTAQEDQIYLLIFELWRRLMSEKPSLSVLCNELDYQIYLYDHQELENPLALHDALMHFLQILEENIDQGISSEQVFKLIAPYSANDIEAFLYDFIAEQIEEGSESFARELIDDFDTYLGNNKWFKLLHIRLCEKGHSKMAQRITEQIIEEHLNDQDLDYNLEFLSVLAEMEDFAIFRTLIKETLPLIEREEDFQDLLVIAHDFFHRINLDQQEMKLQTLLEKRSAYSQNETFNAHDPDLMALAQLFNLKES